MVFLDRFTLSYPRALVADGGRLDGTFAASGKAQVAGLTSPSYLLDLTAATPRWLKGGVTTPAGFAFRVDAQRRYLAVASSAVLHPVLVKPTTSSIQATTNQADYLLIAPSAFLAAAQPLLDLRRSQGLTARAVALEDVFQEFGYGESRPEAVRRFLAYAYHQWRRPSLRYVVLLGDATYDPKDYLKTGVKDHLPVPIVKTSFLWTASDPSYAAVNGDDLLPDIAIGRLSAASVEEARLLVEKVLAFEASGQDLLGDAVLVADNADLGGQLRGDADEIAAGVLATRPVRRSTWGCSVRRRALRSCPPSTRARR